MTTPLPFGAVRVVMVGKGGSGKSTLGGLLCLELARSGDPVAAIDGDTVPGLAQVLGLPPSDRWDLAGTARRRGGGWELDGTPAEVVERCSRVGPEGIRFLQVGNVDANLAEIEQRRDSHLAEWTGTIAFHTVSRQYDLADGWVVVDLQGGTLQVATGLAGTKGIVLLVVEPFAKSLLTARRFAGMGAWAAGIRLAGVANKVESADDVAYVADELGALDIPLWAVVPRDPAVRQAEREGRALATLAADAPTRAAVADLAQRLKQARTERDVAAAGAAAR